MGNVYRQSVSRNSVRTLRVACDFAREVDINYPPEAVVNYPRRLDGAAAPNDVSVGIVGVILSNSIFEFEQKLSTSFFLVLEMLIWSKLLFYQNKQNRRHKTYNLRRKTPADV